MQVKVLSFYALYSLYTKGKNPPRVFGGIDICDFCFNLSICLLIRRSGICPYHSPAHGGKRRYNTGIPEFFYIKSGVYCADKL